MKRYTISIFVSLIATLGVAICRAQNSITQPNIIFIMADDLGYGDLGCYGQTTLATPRIDKLAEEGMRFTDFYAGNTVCRPSRVSLWLGKDPRHTPINGNQDYAMDSELATVAELLKGRGYRTGGVGKWAQMHQGQGHPNEHGFDHWFGYLNQSLAHNHFPPNLWRNQDKVEYPGNVLATGNPDYNGRVSAKKTTFAHTELTTEALSFIKENHRNPFLLHVHWTVPHANNEAGTALADGMEVPDYGSYAERDWPNPEKGFGSMIEMMDTDIGRIADLVDQLGIAENTLIIFTSDNGPHREGNHNEEFFDSNGPLRGLKRDLYEGGIRVPFIARWTNKIAPNSTSNFPAAFWDFLPTACDLAGAEIPSDVDGLSLVPIFLGQKKNRETALVWTFEEGSYIRSAVRLEKWKAVQVDNNTPWELYDLSEDLSETKDLAAQHPDVLEKLTSELAE